MYLPPYYPEQKNGRLQDSPPRTSTPQLSSKPFSPLLTDRPIHLNLYTPGWPKPNDLHLDLSATEASVVIGPRFINRPYARPLSAILERHSTISLRSTRSTRLPKVSVPGASKEKIHPKQSPLRKDSLAQLPTRLKMSFIQHVKGRSGLSEPIANHMSKQEASNGEFGTLSNDARTAPVIGHPATAADQAAIVGPQSSTTDHGLADLLASSDSKKPTSNSTFSPAQRALHILTGQTARGPVQYKPARYVRLPPRVRAKLVSVDQPRDESIFLSCTTAICGESDLLTRFPSPPVDSERSPYRESGTPSPIIAPSPRRPQKRALSGLPLGSADTARIKSFSAWSAEPPTQSVDGSSSYDFVRPGGPAPTMSSSKSTAVSVQAKHSAVSLNDHTPETYATNSGSSSDACCTVRDLGSNELSADSSSPDPGHITVVEPIANKIRTTEEVMPTKSSTSTTQTTSPVYQLDGASPPRRRRGGCEKEPKVKQWKLNRPGMIQFGRAVRGARKRLTLAHVGHTGVRNRCWRCTAKGKVRRLKGKLRDTKSDSSCGECS
ncbi:hypothetical protein KVT40_004355 [Elsinoe batatas]|uniref:Uncharacterized protein n=1 Tax=Elsinoe batatas TaxID=2601811 RepID=A0A8K0L3U3_9PEZI|nr:hypothetical protein KVT40_004355 [Elsinoe batatas]